MLFIGSDQGFVMQMQAARLFWTNPLFERLGTVRRLFANHLDALVIIGVVTIFSTLSINQYIYPHSDHDFYVPQLKYLMDPSLYSSDYITARYEDYYSLLLPFLSVLVPLTGVAIPVVFFILYVLALYLTFLAVYLIAFTLFSNKTVGFISVFFLVFIQPEFAQVTTLDSALLPRSFALPLGLFTVYAFLEKRFLYAYALAGVSFLIHPLTGAFVFAMIFPASIYFRSQIGIPRLVVALIMFVILASPIILDGVNSPQSGSFLIPSAQWVELLRLRSSHHVFPFSWDREIFIAGVLMFLVFVVSWKHRPAENFQHHTILIFTFAILLLLVIGTVFAEIVPIKFIIQYSLLRSAIMLFYFIPIYYANYYIEEIHLSSNLSDYLRVALLSLFLFDLQSESIIIPMGFILVTVVWGIYRLSPKFQRLAAPINTIVRPSMVILLTVFIVLFGIRTYIQKGNFSIFNGDDREWIHVQHWARDNTDKNAIFIVPPHLTGFRIESERAIYVSWKDGTLTFLDEDFGPDWLSRLNTLGYDPYEPVASLEETFRTLDEARVRDISLQLNTADLYLVAFADQPTLDFQLVYENEKFIVYEIPPTPDSA
jgi:hypothetical protein